MPAVSYDHPDGNPCGAKEASTEQPAVFIPIERDVVENVISSTGSDQERPSIAGMLQGPDAGQKRVSNASASIDIESGMRSIPSSVLLELANTTAGLRECHPDAFTLSNRAKRLT